MPQLLFIAIFGFFTYKVDVATMHGAVPLTKPALVAALSPITTANHDNYND